MIDISRNCPLCLGPIKCHGPNSLVTKYPDRPIEVKETECPRCGPFRYTEEALTEFNRLRDLGPDQVLPFAALARERQDLRLPPPVFVTDRYERPDALPEIFTVTAARLALPSSVEARFERALLVLARRGSSPGSVVVVDPTADAPLLGAFDDRGSLYLLEELEGQHLIEKRAMNSFRLTGAGWRRVEEINGRKGPRQADRQVPTGGVFLSYRRRHAWSVAKHVYDALEAAGFDVFMDYRSLGSGDFEPVILGQIAARSHFVLMLGPRCLDGVERPSDWVRREVEHALSLGRNVIPVMFDGFNFGGTEFRAAALKCPSLVQVSKMNGVEIPSPEYLDAALGRLLELLRKAPQTSVAPTPPQDVDRVKVIQEQVRSSSADHDPDSPERTDSGRDGGGESPEAEVRAAGFEVTQTREPWWELPHPLQAAERTAPAHGRPQRGFLAALSEIDFHLVVLVVALAIPVLGFRLPPWLGVAFGLLVPQGRILGHASDRRRRGEPWLAYTIVNEAFVLAVVGAYARLR